MFCVCPFRSFVLSSRAAFRRPTVPPFVLRPSFLRAESPCCSSGSCRRSTRQDHTRADARHGLGAQASAGQRLFLRSVVQSRVLSPVVPLVVLRPSSFVLRSARVTTARVTELLAREAETGFRRLAGTALSGTVPVTEAVISELLLRVPGAPDRSRPRDSPRQSAGGALPLRPRDGRARRGGAGGRSAADWARAELERGGVDTQAGDQGAWGQFRGPARDHRPGRAARARRLASVLAAPALRAGADRAWLRCISTSRWPSRRKTG